MMASKTNRTGPEIIPGVRGSSMNRARRVIIYNSNQLGEMVEEAEQILLASEAEVYQRGSDLVRVGFGEISGASGQRIRIAQVYKVEEPFLLAELTRFIDWKRPSDDDFKRIGPPGSVAKALLKRAGISGLRRLEGVIMCPTLRPDGTVLSYLGYDEGTKLLLVEPPVMEPIPDNPTREQAEVALGMLDELLDEFPFVDEASHSVGLSGLITPVVRGALVCVPLHAITAPEAGTGKSFLLDTVSMIALGQSCPPMTAGKDLDEFDKRLHSELLAGTPLFSIDNATIELGGDALCQAIERPVINIRPLGRSERIQLPNTVTIFANGNNLSFVDDVNRRVLRCGLDAKMEEPRKRQFQGNPVAAVMRDRGRYISAALMVVRAYVAAGMPDRPPGIGESFARWSDMVRGALLWLGRADPVLTMDTAHEQDPAVRQRAQVFQAIHSAVGDGWMSASAIIGCANKLPDNTDIDKTDALRLALEQVAERRGSLSHIALGKWLSANRSKVVAGLVLESDEDKHSKAWVWRVRRLG